MLIRQSMPVKGEAGTGYILRGQHLAQLMSVTDDELRRWIGHINLRRWQPKQAGLISDLDRPRYFET